MNNLFLKILSLISIILLLNCNNCRSSSTDNATQDSFKYSEILTATLSMATLDSLVNDESFQAALPAVLVSREDVIARSDLRDTYNIITRNDFTQPVPIELETFKSMMKLSTNSGYAYVSTLIFENEAEGDCTLIPKYLLDSADELSNDVVASLAIISSNKKCSEKGSFVIQVMSESETGELSFITVLTLSSPVSVEALVYYEDSNDKVYDTGILEISDSGIATAEKAVPIQVASTWELFMTLGEVPVTPGFAIVGDELYVIGTYAGDNEPVTNKVINLTTKNVEIIKSDPGIWHGEIVLATGVGIIAVESRAEADLDGGNSYAQVFYADANGPDTTFVNFKTEETNILQLSPPRVNLSATVSRDSPFVWFFGGAISVGSGVEIYATVDRLEWPEFFSQNNPTVTMLSMADLPTPTKNSCAVSDEGLISVIGGLSNSDQPTDTFNLYAVDENEWSVRPNLPTPRAKHQCVVWLGQIWTMGGISLDGQPTDTIDVYNVGDADWTSAGIQLPTGLQLDFRLSIMQGFAMAIDSQGIVYVGVGENGEIWRINLDAAAN